MTPIVVYVEHQDGAPSRASLETIAAAQTIGDQIVAVLAGPGAGEAAAAVPAAKAVTVARDQHSPSALAQDIAAVVRDEGAGAFLAGATSTGADIAPRVAALLDSNLFSGCTAIERKGDTIELTRPLLAGKLIATQSSSAPVLCATVRRNYFQAAEGGGAAVSEASGVDELKAVLIEIAAKPEGKLDVSEAPVIVAGGRGLKEAEGFGLIEDLAAAFGNAAVGASRAVVDAGWRPHSEQVGQTGKVVSPQLYIAVGISGAIQHLAGMKTSKVIVAVNKDPEAPIFKVADYGIVGDAAEVLPVLTEAVKAARAEG